MNFSKVKLFFKKYVYIIIIIIIIIVPLIIGLIYGLDFPQIIAIDSGDLINYYAIVCGAIGSVWIYLDTKRKEQREKYFEFKPKFALQLKKIDEKYFKYSLSITNCDKRNDVKEVEVCMVHVFGIIEAGKTKEVEIAFECVENVEYVIDYDVTEYVKCNNEDYPKDILITCRDINGDNWECYFRAITNGLDNIYYTNYYIEAM